jgi:hypothetical protein
MTPEEARALITTSSYHKIEYGDFESIVQAVYDQEYEFVADVECGNDSEHSFTDVTKGSLDKYGPYDRQTLEEFKSIGKYGYGTARILLNDLVDQELIPEGNYLITVSW